LREEQNVARQALLAQESVPHGGVYGAFSVVI